VNVRKLSRLLGDLVRVNARYLTSGGHRNMIRAALKVDGLDGRQHRLIDVETAAAAPQARAFSGLASTSMTLATIRLSSPSAPHINLVIGEVRENAVYAGIRTALIAAAELCQTTNRPLRVVMVDFTSPENNLRHTEAYIRRTFGVNDVTLVAREALGGATFGETDIWLASHWKTAHALSIACDSGLIDPRRVAYLIQDYEPGFSAWSTEYALASATYHAGFVPIVNSVPLWQFLTEEERLSIDRSLVFAPQFENELLRAVAARRTTGAPVRVLLYGRPSKHRNLYRLGLSALRAAVVQLGDTAREIEFYSAGEPHEAIDLGDGVRMTALGKLPWQEYFDFLATVQVVLSLQLSPHPSHPPFDAAISGATAITNEFHGSRAGLHPRLIAVPADPTSLGLAVAAAIRTAGTSTAAGYLPVAANTLGGTLPDALGAAVEKLTLD